MDEVSVLSSKIVTAKKSHQCNWCGERIAQGEKYTREFVVWEGDAWTKKVHVECAAAEETYDFRGDDLFYEGQFQRGHNHEHNWATVEDGIKNKCPGCIEIMRVVKIEQGDGK